MYGKENETVSHIISSCEKLTQKYYKQWGHDKVAQILHWNLCKKYELRAATKFYDHVPEKVSENDLVKILWDFNIKTDKNWNTISQILPYLTRKTTSAFG